MSTTVIVRFINIATVSLLFLWGKGLRLRVQGLGLCSRFRGSGLKASMWFVGEMVCFTW